MNKFLCIAVLVAHVVSAEMPTDPEEHQIWEAQQQLQDSVNQLKGLSQMQDNKIEMGKNTQSAAFIEAEAEVEEEDGHTPMVNGATLSTYVTKFKNIDRERDIEQRQSQRNGDNVRKANAQLADAATQAKAQQDQLTAMIRKQAEDIKLQSAKFQPVLLEKKSEGPYVGGSMLKDLIYQGDMAIAQATENEESLNEDMKEVGELVKDQNQYTVDQNKILRAHGQAVNNTDSLTETAMEPWISKANLKEVMDLGNRRLKLNHEEKAELKLEMDLMDESKSEQDNGVGFSSAGTNKKDPLLDSLKLRALSKERYVQPSGTSSISLTISVTPSSSESSRPTPAPSVEAIRPPAPIDSEQFGDILDVLHIGLDQGQKDQLMAVMALQQMQAQQKQTNNRAEQENDILQHFGDLTSLSKTKSKKKVLAPAVKQLTEQEQAVIAAQSVRKENMMKETLEDTQEWQQQNRASFLKKLMKDKKSQPVRATEPVLAPSKAPVPLDPRRKANYPSVIV